MDDKYWKFIIDAANSIRKVLNDKPQALKIGYHLSPNGILSAYREGDLNYNQACDILEKLIRKTPNTKEDLQNDTQQQKDVICSDIIESKNLCEYCAVHNCEKLISYKEAGYVCFIGRKLTPVL